MATNGQIQSLAVSSVTRSRDEAIALASEYGIDVKPINNDVTYVFIVYPLSSFVRGSTHPDRRGDHYFIRGVLNEEGN